MHKKTQLYGDQFPDKADRWHLVTDAVSSWVKFIGLHIYVCLGIIVVTDVPTHFQHISHFELNSDLIKAKR